MRTPNFNVGKERLTAQCEPCEVPLTPVQLKIRACLFFDGTGNNKFNTNAGLKGIVKGDSYLADLSNIDRLSNAFEFYKQPYDIQFAVYIVGIGTGGDSQDSTVWGKGISNSKKGDGENRKNDLGQMGDSTIGNAIGAGATGIQARADLAFKAVCSEIARRIKVFKRKKKVPDTAPVVVESVELDAFGFSRGAATARRFVYLVLNTIEYGGRGGAIPKPAGLANSIQKIPQVQSVGMVKFVFLGLYDTVSSFAAGDDNVATLKLNWLNQVDRVVHLCAADEHRSFFALTNINSAAGNGVEIFLPGVHSDIGGGYRDNTGDFDQWVFNLETIEKLLHRPAGRTLIRRGGRILEQWFECTGGSRHTWAERNEYALGVWPKSTSICPAGYISREIRSYLISNWPDQYEEWPDEWIESPQWTMGDREKYEIEQRWLTQSGWYLDSLRRIEERSDRLFKLKGFASTRSMISNRYSFVTLQMMADFAADARWKMKFNRKNIYGIHSLSKYPFLRNVQLKLQSYVAEKCGPIPTSSGIGSSRWSDWFSYPEPCNRASQYPWLAVFRQKYSHFSAYFTSGIQGYIGVNNPNYINGRRQRRIING